MSERRHPFFSGVIKGDSKMNRTSSNPALRAFSNPASLGYGTDAGQMTVQGTVNKTALSLLLAFLAASITWGMPSLAFPLIMAGGLGGLVIAIGLAFKPEWASVGTPVYALLQGAAMGALSGIFNNVYPGIAFQAIGITFGVLACMLAAYTSGVVRATEKFKLGVMTATGGIFVFYLGSFLMSFLGFHNPAFDSGLLGIGFSLFVVVIASLNLVLDFAFIEEASASGAPQYMEWYGAFTLMVTLVWLYIEILHLLAKSRD
jgi:uncharacterized YccA/Bax inhibitor family protein